MERVERGWEPVDITVVAGAVTRTVVSQTKGELGPKRAARTFVVSGNRREPLPLPGPVDDRKIPLSQFLFSPDEATLIAQRCFSSTNWQAFVYHRARGLRYVLASGKSLEQQIAERFGAPPERPVTEEPNHLEMQCWLPNGELLISCYYGTHRVGINYQVVLEPRTGRLRAWKLLKDKQTLNWPEKFERYPQTRLRPLVWREVDSWSYTDLNYAINEMYARRRYSFNDQPKIRVQFEKLGFYPDPLVTKDTIKSLMWPTERHNLDLLTRRSLLKLQRKAG